MSLATRIHQLSFSPNKKENLDMILKLISESDAYLDVFPEYSMGMPSKGIDREFIQKNAEPLEGEFIRKIVEGTLRRNSAVVFTTFLKEDNTVYNAAVLAEKGKIVVVYRKIHLFDAFGYKESAMFAPGKKLAITNLGSFKIGLAVCFDLRFPELFRAMAYSGVNLFVVPSGWYKGEYKIEQWRALVVARAHENGAYLMAADQTNPFFIGHSTVTSPLGYTIKELREEQTSFALKLDFEEICKARSLLPTLSLSKRDLYSGL